MRVQNENRRDPSKSTLHRRRRRRPRGRRRSGCREEESGFETEREREGKKEDNRLPQLLDDGTLDIALPATRAEGGSPSALQISSR